MLALYDISSAITIMHLSKLSEIVASPIAAIAHEPKRITIRF